MDNLKYWAENWDWESAYAAEEDGYKTPLKRLQACVDQGIPTVQKHAPENYEVVNVTNAFFAPSTNFSTVK